MSVPVLSARAQARKLPPTSCGRWVVQGVQRGKPRSGSKSLWDRTASKVSSRYRFRLTAHVGLAPRLHPTTTARRTRRSGVSARAERA
jgi:hypothetical protein